MASHQATSLHGTQQAPDKVPSNDAATRIRVIPELRNYHVALLDQMTPAHTYFFQRKYDLADGDLPASLEQVSFTRLLRLVIGSGATTLELWEPLWVRLLARHVTLGLAWRLGRPGRSRRLVSAAMENNDLTHLIGGRRSAFVGLETLFKLALGLYLRLVYTRLVFATDGARSTYHSIPGVRSIPHLVITHLPRRPNTLRPIPKVPDTVVFLARLERRKGIAELMAQWPQIVSARPEARLVIIGDGPETDSVERWCADDPVTRHLLGALPHEKALSVLERAQVLILPSVREGRWREQVGLPLHEGLVAGATIVTTDESGLAPWLTRHGHHVVAAAHIETALAGAVIDALGRPLPPAEVIAALPDLDARVAQNRWLHHG